MSGETEKQVSGWTTDTLKDHVEQRFMDQEKAVNAALAAAEKAVAVAEKNAEKWREQANEWRGAMNDRERSLMPRSEAEQGSKSNAEKIDALAARVDKAEGLVRGLMALFVIISALGVLVGIFIALRKVV